MISFNFIELYRSANAQQMQITMTTRIQVGMYIIFYKHQMAYYRIQIKKVFARKTTAKMGADNNKALRIVLKILHPI
jgi:hypothetical protein